MSGCLCRGNSSSRSSRKAYRSGRSRRGWVLRRERSSDGSAAMASAPSGGRAASGRPPRRTDRASRARDRVSDSRCHRLRQATGPRVSLSPVRERFRCAPAAADQAATRRGGRRVLRDMRLRPIRRGAALPPRRSRAEELLGRCGGRDPLSAGRSGRGPQVRPALRELSRRSRSWGWGLAVKWRAASEPEPLRPG